MMYESISASSIPSRSSSWLALSSVPSAAAEEGRDGSTTAGEDRPSRCRLTPRPCSAPRGVGSSAERGGGGAAEYYDILLQPGSILVIVVAVVSFSKQLV